MITPLGLFKKLILAIFAVLVASIALHPRVFGIAWYLAVICGLCSIIILFQHQTKQWQMFLDSSKIWAIAVTPPVLTSLFSVYYFDVRLGRAEILEVAIGGFGLLGLLCYLRPKMNFVCKLFLTATILGFGIAAYEIFYLGHFRAGDSFNPINFGIGSGLIIIFLLWCTAHGIAKVNFLVTLLSFFTLVASASRGPILATAILGIIFWRIFPNIFSAIFSGPYRFLLLSILVSVGMVVLGWRFSWDLAAEAGASSIGIRFELWSVAVSRILSTPFMGIGADGTGLFLSGLEGSITDFTHVHNTFLNIGLEQGLPGMIALGWMFLVLAWRTCPPRIQQHRFFSLGLLLVFYFFLCSLTQEIFSHAYLRQLFPLGLSLALISTISIEDCEQQSKS